MNRREFLHNAAFSAAAFTLGFRGEYLHAAVNAASVPEKADINTLFSSSFEEGQPLCEAGYFNLCGNEARSGTKSLVNNGPADGKRYLAIAVEAKAGDFLKVSFWLKTDQEATCSVFVRFGAKRLLVERADNIQPGSWRLIEAGYWFDSDIHGHVEIEFPAEANRNQPTVWIDDVDITASKIQDPWPPEYEEYPVILEDAKGGVWLSCIDRTQIRPVWKIQRLFHGKRHTIHTLDNPVITGIDRPFLAAYRDGVLATTAIEKDDNWSVVCVFIESEHSTPIQKHINMPGPGVNIHPAAAVDGNQAVVVWESNIDKKRGIYASIATPGGHTAPVRISAASANAYNPSVVCTRKGKAFAAWDSVQNRHANLFGAWYKHGEWQPEQRLTQDTRIERHPRLAVLNDELWMCWQIQSYMDQSFLSQKDNFNSPYKLNDLNEQRIAAARLNTDGSLSSPKDLFTVVSPRHRMLVRPAIRFDSKGRLWLSAREPLSMHAGWIGRLWTYTGSQWHQHHMFTRHQGRVAPLYFAFDGNGILAATQYDDQPMTWEQFGITPDWKSGITIASLPEKEFPPARPLELEPLKRPDGTFSLAERIDLCAADHKPMKKTHKGQPLSLYWGALHDHSDLSVCVRDTNPPTEDLYANERDIEQLDFISVTDHGYNFDPRIWNRHSQDVRAGHDAGRFVTFLGQEWTSSNKPPEPGGKSNRYGHHNIIFLDPHHEDFYDAWDHDESPGSVWGKLADSEFIFIPHQIADWRYEGKGNPPTDWTYHDERLQPVAEIYQVRGSYEYLGCPQQAPDATPFKGYYLQDAWEKGLVIGVIASPDHGGGRGKVGVWARSLAREDIFEAIRARHTFGTSGPKMNLYFASGDAIMGDKLGLTDRPVEFAIEASANRPIREAVIFRNNEPAFTQKTNDKAIQLTWTEKTPALYGHNWYYCRIETKDGELAWSSPIWLTDRA